MQYRVADDVISIKYEDFLSNPLDYMKKISEFITLPATDESIREVCKEIKTATRTKMAVTKQRERKEK